MLLNRAILSAKQVFFSFLQIKVDLIYNVSDVQQSDSYIYAAATAKSLQSCPTLCDPIDGSPPGSPIPGILQARILEWLPFPSPMRESEK